MNKIKKTKLTNACTNFKSLAFIFAKTYVNETYIWWKNVYTISDVNCDN